MAETPEKLERTVLVPESEEAADSEARRTVKPESVASEVAVGPQGAEQGGRSTQGTAAELSGTVAETPTAASASQAAVVASEAVAAGTHPAVHVSQQVLQLTPVAQYLSIDRSAPSSEESEPLSY